MSKDEFKERENDLESLADNGLTNSKFESDIESLADNGLTKSEFESDNQLLAMV